jgi:hypothetical protein
MSSQENQMLLKVIVFLGAAVAFVYCVYQLVYNTHPHV